MLDLGRQAIDARLTLNGRTTAPLRAPLALALQAKATGARGDGRLTLDLGDTRVALAGRAQDARHAELTIDQIRVAPALVRAFVPSYPVIVPAEVAGRASLRGDQVTAELDLAAASTRAELKARADIARKRVDQLRLQARHIDVGAIVRDGPRSRFDLEVEGHGGGASAETAQGAVALRVLPGARIDDRPFGPVRVRARAERGRYRLDELLAILPGLQVKGSGQADRQLAGRRSGGAGAGPAADRAQPGGAARAEAGGAGRLHRGGARIAPGAGGRRARARAGAARGGKRRGRAAPDRARAGPVAAAASGRAAARGVAARGRPAVRAGVPGRGGRRRPVATSACRPVRCQPQRFQLAAGGQAHRRRARTCAPIDLARLDLEYPQASWRLAGGRAWCWTARMSRSQAWTCAPRAASSCGRTSTAGASGSRAG